MGAPRPGSCKRGYQVDQCNDGSEHGGGECCVVDIGIILDRIRRDGRSIVKPRRLVGARCDLSAMLRDEAVIAMQPRRNSRRTFGRRHRHRSVGDFSAQCLTDAAER